MTFASSRRGTIRSRVLRKRIQQRIAKECSGILARNIFPTDTWSVNRPVFMIGSPRSGTSILSELLAIHPDVANYSEANEVWERLCTFNRPFWEDPELEVKIWQDSMNDKEMKIVRQTFAIFQKIAQRQVFLNKCHRNTLRLPTIAKMFPTAKYVHIYRDGRDVAHSISTHKMVKGVINASLNIDDELLTALAKFWAKNIDAVESYKSTGLLTQDNFYEIKFEDFCVNPSDHINALLSFLDLSHEKFDYSVLDLVIKRNSSTRKNVDPCISNLIHKQLQAKGYV